jgi:cell division protein FtsZ
MGIGRGTGDSRTLEAAKQAVDSPLLELSIEGAKGILFNITGGPDLGMYEIDEAARIITEAADPDANIIFGAVIDEAMQGEVKITVVATGFDDDVYSVAPGRRRMEQVGARAGLGMTQQKEAEAEDKDEIDVPAFIRKKIK